MELLMPGLGLIFWMTVAFGCVLLILKKYAWKPILNVLEQREIKLAQSFNDARRIEYEITQLDALKTTKIAEAEKLHSEIVAKARTEADTIIAEAKEKAAAEARIIIDKADEMVEAYKKEALREVKNQLSALSFDIAEKIIVEEFSDKERNAAYVNKLLDKVMVN